MDLKSLIRQRGTIKGKITRISTFVNTAGSDNVEQLQARHDGMADILKQFEEIQIKIENLVCEEKEEIFDEHSKYRVDFENDYYDVLSKVKGKINSVSKKEYNSSQQTPGPYKAKLPTITLPTFDGDYLSWQSFEDSFRSLVHNVDNIPKITKFQYLKCSLSGDAANLIESLNVTDANYEIAWNLISERYNNKRIIVQTHINAIFNSPRIETPNSVAIRNLHNNINKHLRALKALGEPTEQWSTLLVHIVGTKLDKTTLKRWEESLKGTDVPIFETLLQFLEDTGNSLEGYESKNKSSMSLVSCDKAVRLKGAESKRNNCLFSQNGSIPFCPLCKQAHKIYSCDRFLGQNLSDRKETVKTLGLCFNCLSKNHSVKDCRGSSCKHCNSKHNTLLHINQPIENKNSKHNTLLHANPPIENKNSKPNSDASTSKETADNSANTSICNFSNNAQSGFKVLLSTSVVKIKDKYGNFHYCRAVLDSGSQLSFITKRLSNKLKLEKHKTSILINGIDGSNAHTVSYINADIYSNISNFNATLSLHVLPNITNSIPIKDIHLNRSQIPHHIKNNLADPKFDESSSIDLLLGAEIFFHLLKPEQVYWGNRSLIFQNTVLGWVVSGKINSQISNSASSLFITAASSNQKENDSFISQKMNHEEELCVNSFETAKRDSAGRFIVQLPFKSDPSCLDDNLSNCIKRFNYLERRFNSQPHVHEQYVNFMREYEKLGHMREVKVDELHKKPRYYIPHHPVFKESTTTQIRVVFDATCKSSDGKSLNSILLKGPVIQSDIFAIMIRFRMNKYALTGDVAKMYRQILIDEKHIEFQRIVWRETPDQELKHYQLLTLTYGTTPASFIATKCLSHLAQEYKDSFPLASHIIENDFYMDDLMTGSDSYEELKIIQFQVSKILQSGCFILRKWCSNSRDLLKQISSDSDDTHYITNLGTCENVKTLGLIWKPFIDTFEFNINPPQHCHTVSRRIILSELSKIFDPLGFLTPVIIKGKIFVQQLWLNSLEWDDPLPYDLAQKWIMFSNQLSLLEEFQIPRRAKYSSTIELHGFCDASENAYAACVYIRSIEENKINVSLLCSKARVAPLKKRTIPELELNAAKLLTQLMLKITNSFQSDSNTCHYWTDSAIVLAWLLKNPHQLKTYTSNRVAFIQENSTISKWKHVKSEHNPSDIASRGIDVNKFLTSTIWLNGPCWLSLPQTEWPPSRINHDNINIPELKPINYSLINSCTTNQELDLLVRYSSWTRLVRVVAYIFRFIDNLTLKKGDRRHGYLTTYELHKAKLKIYQLTQAEGFSKEIKALTEETPLDKKSKIYDLKPFLDKEKLLRVGGRLENSQLPECRMHPILLPYAHHVTKLIFKHYHKVYFHTGPQNLLSIIRQLYWPVKGKIMAKQTCKQCTICFKANPKNTPALMGQLPKERVQISRPFSITGIDFAGPIMIRAGLRKSTKTKAYICVFVCFVTRAIHLELVSDLTTSAFIASLKRFMSRRGVCSKIYSDNATNFVGASKELRKLFANQDMKKSVPEQLASEGVEWNFIPARSPHFGGIWEAGVKCVKYHLRRTIGDTVLNFEELYTVLSQIEAILNSRPLTTLSSSPVDLTPLTPAHFLVGDSLLFPAEEDLTGTRMNRLKRWQMVQAMVQHFWKRWSSEFLMQLQQRSKWRECSNNIQLGDIVLLDNTSLPPQHWIMARVSKVHPGADGIVRVATVTTSSGKQFTRAVNKLYPLPGNIED